MYNLHIVAYRVYKFLRSMGLVTTPARVNATASMLYAKHGELVTMPGLTL